MKQRRSRETHIIDNLIALLVDRGVGSGSVRDGVLGAHAQRGSDLLDVSRRKSERE